MTFRGGGVGVDCVAPPSWISSQLEFIMLKALHLYLVSLGSDTVASEVVGGTYRVIFTLLLAPFV